MDKSPIPDDKDGLREVAKYRHCFVCGEDNQHGLQAKFYFDGKQAISSLTATDAFEGYRGIYHGGILSAMLDEVMIKAILAQDIFAVTAELTVRFVKPVTTGDSLTFIGRVTETKGRMYMTEGEVVGSDGSAYATATGKYIKARPELQAKLMDSVDQP
ncbi:hotdog fold thioesterase [candidate division GN15 bacterium]|nr:hotdog fold thioesterase [candidate division GN15 bacterium]